MPYVEPGELNKKAASLAVPLLLPFVPLAIIFPPFVPFYSFSPAPPEQPVSQAPLEKSPQCRVPGATGSTVLPLVFLLQRALSPCPRVSLARAGSRRCRRCNNQKICNSPAADATNAKRIFTTARLKTDGAAPRLVNGTSWLKPVRGFFPPRFAAIVVDGIMVSPIPFLFCFCFSSPVRFYSRFPFIFFCRKGNDGAGCRGQLTYRRRADRLDLG